MKLNQLNPETRVFTAWNGSEVKKSGPRQVANYKYFHRVRRYLSGSWPLAEPPMAYATDVGECEIWWRKAKHSDYFVVDTEYSYPGPKYVYMLGLYAPSAGTLQWESKDNYLADSFVRDFYCHLISVKPVVFQNFEADMPAMKTTFGVGYNEYAAGVEDTLLMHHVLWSEMPHDLEHLETLYGQYEKAKHLQGIDELRYNAFDAITTGCVFEAVREELRKEPGCERVYREELLRLIPIILEMEERGLPIDSDFVRLAFDDTQDRVEKAATLAEAYAGWPINLDSSDQLGAVLFAGEDIYTEARKKGARLRQVKTEGGALSLDKDVIAGLRQAFEPLDPDRDEDDWNYIQERVDGDAHPLIEARAFHSAARQNRSSYLTPLLRTRDGEPLPDKERKRVAKGGPHSGYLITDRIYPRFNITGQATGRWSTTGPPLAQLPGHLYGILAVDPEWPEYYFDWDQIELRLCMIALAKDPLYQEWFANGYDPHSLAACDCLGIPYPPDATKFGIFEGAASADWRHKYGVTDDEWLPRKFAKTFIYRLMYRGEPKYAGDVTGARQLGLDTQRLVAAAERWLAAHPNVPKLWQRLDTQIARDRCVYNAFGRRRKLLSPDHNARIREGGNFPIQSAVGDMMNEHIISVYERSSGRCIPRWTKHDAVYWAVHIDYWDEGRALIREEAEREWEIEGTRLRIPATFGERMGDHVLAAV